MEFSVSSTRWRISFVENNYYIHGNKPIHIRLWKLRNIKCLLFLISNYDLLTFKNVVPQIKNEFWPYIFEHCKFHHIHSPFTIILLVKGFFFLNWISKDLCPKTDHWIGLNDISEEKIFVWVGDSTVRSLVIVLIVFTKYWMNIDCRYLVFIYIYIYILLLNIHFMTNTYVHKI